MIRKQMIGRAAGLALCGALLTTSLSGCGIIRKFLGQQQTTQTTTTPNHHTSGIELPEVKQEDEVSSESELLHPMIRYFTDSVADVDYNTLVSTKYSYAVLSPEDAAAYPALALALDTYGSKMEEEHERMFEEESREIKDYIDTYGYADYSYTNELNSFVLRADKVCFSVLECDYYYGGGAHGWSGYGGVNYDTQTGKELDASDVISDMDAFKEYYVDAIMNQVDDDYLARENVEEYWEEMKAGTWGWNMVMDYEGITFYIAPGNLTAYAAGVLQVRLNYVNQADLIVDKYEQVPKEYIVELSPFQTSYIDYDMDGVEETLNVGYTENEYNIEGVSVVADNKECYAEIYGYKIRPFYVRTNGKSYLYVWANSENDWQRFELFDLNGSVATYTGNMYSRFLLSGEYDWYESSSVDGGWMNRYTQMTLTDPNFMPLSYRVDKFSTTEGYIECHVDPTGAIVDNENYFDVSEDCFDRWFTNTEKYPLEVTALMDVTAYEVLSNGTVGNETVIPSGDMVTFVGTDDDTFADVLYDGRVLRIYFTGDYNNIQGYDIFDVFEGVFFAG